MGVDEPRNQVFSRGIDDRGAGRCFQSLPDGLDPIVTNDQVGPRPRRGAGTVDERPILDKDKVSSRGRCPGCNTPIASTSSRSA